VFEATLNDPHGEITWQLVAGAFFFGVGWGLGGLCPGPFLLVAPISLKTLVYWGLPCLISMKIASLFTSKKHSK
jgi:uncharacterized membrane protein YedE/YeeE